MFGKKIKFYRQRNGLTLTELANSTGLTKAAISQYENNKRTPSEELIEKIADYLGVSVLDLLENSRREVNFQHQFFHKNGNLSQREIDEFLCKIKERCTNQIEIMEILNVLPKDKKSYKQLKIDDDIEENAYQIRKTLSIGENGPVYSIINLLERLGIIVITFDFDERIEGCSGTADDIPYIFYSNKTTIEKERFILVHEYCHLFFNSHSYYNEKEFENRIDEISSAILLPREDLLEKFGQIHRKTSIFLINSVAEEYQVLPSILINRLRNLSIINESNYRKLKTGLKENNENKIDKANHETGQPILLKQMVYRALDNELITISKASEILKQDIEKLI